MRLLVSFVVHFPEGRVWDSPPESGSIGLEVQCLSPPRLISKCLQQCLVCADFYPSPVSWIDMLSLKDFLIKLLE